MYGGFKGNYCEDAYIIDTMLNKCTKLNDLKNLGQSGTVFYKRKVYVFGGYVNGSLV